MTVVHQDQYFSRAIKILVFSNADLEVINTMHGAHKDTLKRLGVSERIWYESGD